VLPVHLDQIDENLVQVLSGRDRDALDRILRKLRDHIRPDAAQGSSG
jgi:hypothetical protein